MVCPCSIPILGLCRIYLREVQNQVSSSHKYNKEIVDWYNFWKTVGVRQISKSIRLSMPKGLWKTPLFNKRQNGSMQQMLWARSTKMRKKYFLIFWVILNFTSHSLLFMGSKSWQELINSHMLEWHVFQCLIKISWNLETSDVTKDLFVFKCGFSLLG